ncbi:MAG: short-chain dehydrogenase [Bacteroidetes bacterium GWD2_45_23]|nr:MAG: short-chain dehydrogenase [Bacteroidetes bacterium GWC2_46_850]OFX86710.1 MAG: short-chain dehydrogenase [Bacteroidetes bacterium GWD2_45_23]HAR38577.1 short-chain dehydrogenase [Porphyromonadaceae bacterium]HBB01983.1 short-chain dehydrogenase [Porphyromonadaceae bacterium]HCC19502.1 short-chain dehydrogenase [Porphyromonadaceae bacterium]
MSKTALITGASKGIGKELAFLFAEKGHNLVLVARSAETLKKIKMELEETCSVSVHTLVVDLCDAVAAQAVFDEVKKKGVDIDYLVNNAGFGDYGAFADTGWECYERMIALNVTTLTHLTHLFVSDWRGRKAGRILNISSTAAFQPGPMMAVYFATKSFVLHLSEGLGEELKKEHITVTTLCPGPTSTNFGEVSKMKASQLVKNVQIADAKEVAELGYRAMMRGKAVVIHGAMNKLAPFGIRFLPRKWVTRLSAKIMQQ